MWVVNKLFRITNSRSRKGNILSCEFGGVEEEQWWDEEIKGDWVVHLRVGGSVGGWGFKGGVFGMWWSKARSGKQVEARRGQQHEGGEVTLSPSHFSPLSLFISLSLAFTQLSFPHFSSLFYTSPSSSNLFPGKHLYSAQISFCKLPEEEVYDIGVSVVLMIPAKKYEWDWIRLCSILFLPSHLSQSPPTSPAPSLQPALLSLPNHLVMTNVWPVRAETATLRTIH